MSGHLEVLRAGLLATIQDLGRFGHRASGVSPSGAADLASCRRANALAGNDPRAAVIEVTSGHLRLRAAMAITVAVTGAPCDGVEMDAAIDVPAGGELALGSARAGLRTYLAVRGGFDVPQVLGSRSTDTFAGLGPAPLRDGQRLLVGALLAGADRGVARAPARPLQGAVDLTVLRGPRDDWLRDDAWGALDSEVWQVSPESNRVAVRLRGQRLAVREGSLAPEPLIRGAVQVPPDGQPLVFLADHPVTGGYPVVGVLSQASCDAIAQRRPGSAVRLLPGVVNGLSSPR